MINPKLPLIDLHRHLDGNIRPSTIWQLAQKHNIKLPENTFNEFIPHVRIQGSENNLLDFLKKLDWGVAVLKHVDDCKRVAMENVEDAYNAGLHYAELRFSPMYMSKQHQLPIKEVVAAVIDGVNAGMKQYDIKINLIGIMSRTYGLKSCQLELDALLSFKEQLVAIDLAGDEYNFPGDLFCSQFKQVSDAGLYATIHAGEASGPSSIWQAITELKAHRIGHGVATYKDEALMNYMIKNNISIESCLTSNYQTGTVTDLFQHPIKTFLAHGIKVCLNTDDPSVQGIEIKDEYALAKNHLLLTDSEIDILQRNSLDMSFLSNSDKKELQNKVL